MTRLSLRGRGIPEDLWARRDLTVLALGANPVAELPEAIGELVRLERLYLDDMGLVAPPAALSRLTRLRTLDLGHNRLASLPDLSGLRALEILYVHDNRLTGIPAWELPALTYLNVSDNPLRGLPALRGPLIELRAMHAGLTALPALALPALRELHLRGNALREVPESVRGLRSLRHLDLRQNRLTAVPEWVTELPLEKLDLRWNDFDHPPDAPPGLRERGCVVLTD